MHQEMLFEDFSDFEASSGAAYSGGLPPRPAQRPVDQDRFHWDDDSEDSEDQGGSGFPAVFGSGVPAKTPGTPGHATPSVLWDHSDDEDDEDDEAPVPPATTRAGNSGHLEPSAGARFPHRQLPPLPPGVQSLALPGDTAMELSRIPGHALPHLHRRVGPPGVASAPTYHYAPPRVPMQPGAPRAPMSTFEDPSSMSTFQAFSSTPTFQAPSSMSTFQAPWDETEEGPPKSAGRQLDRAL
ncbi:hypothetical protein T484DRAFT_1775536 [Baffinella frigidus]|nr:hypothetical protein T484DRAFT_1775536 [Cryptophyta sp. CCMP2293]